MRIREERSLELLLVVVGFGSGPFERPAPKLVDPIRPLGSHVPGIGPRPPPTSASARDLPKEVV